MTKVTDILTVNENQTASEIFKDWLLHQLAYRKITNYSWLNNFYKQYGDKINQLDKSYLVNYSSEIIRWLHILKNNKKSA